MNWPDDVLCIVLAAVLGGVLGLEREIRGKAAGLRTNVLICLGAAVFTMISRQMAGGQEVSVTRIAAGVVSGVGFLGAGAIIREAKGIHGLTTAATIWMVASIGMACGARLYVLAILSTCIAMVVLIGLAELEKPLGRFRKKQEQRNISNEDN